MAFWNSETLALEEFRPGIMSKAVMGHSLLMACMEIGKGKEDPGHRHPFDQCGIVLSGKMEMFIGKERKLLSPNDCYFIPSGEEHGWKTLDESVKILDVTLKPAQP